MGKNRWYDFMNGIRESEKKAANFCLVCLKDRMVGAFKKEAVSTNGLLEEEWPLRIEEIEKRSKVNTIINGGFHNFSLITKNSSSLNL